MPSLLKFRNAERCFIFFSLVSTINSCFTEISTVIKALHLKDYIGKERSKVVKHNKEGITSRQTQDAFIFIHIVFPTPRLVVENN